MQSLDVSEKHRELGFSELWLSNAIIGGIVKKMRNANYLLTVGFICAKQLLPVTFLLAA
jgi:hypothetical protein